MKKSSADIKTNLIYGLIVVVPVAIFVIILVKFVEALEIIAKSIGLHSTVGASLAIILALIFLGLACYGLGYLIRTRIGAWVFNRFEKTVLLQIPGYKIISGILKGFAADRIESYRPALIQLGTPGTAVLGFVMEENNDGTLTIFVPSVPAITVGGLLIVERNRVTLIDAPHREIVNCITEWGMGSSKFIGKVQPDTE